MIQWEGTITYKKKRLKATIYYQNPTSNQHGFWFGDGISNDDWPLFEPIKTNVGKIVLSDPLIIKDGWIYKVEGLGEPEMVLTRLIDKTG